MGEGPVADALSKLRSGKVVVSLKPIKDAPLLRPDKVDFELRVDGCKPFFDIKAFVQKMVNQGKDVHVYCVDAFEPAEEEKVDDLFKCFAIGGKLTLSYSIEPAFR